MECLNFMPTQNKTRRTEDKLDKHKMNRNCLNQDKIARYKQICHKLAMVSMIVLAPRRKR